MNIYYVYIYRDPRKEGHPPFYIGKGSGNRSLAHLLETVANTDNHRKFLKIQKIRQAGLEPIIELYAIELLEEDAYELEASLIKHYGRAKIDPGGILTNICLDNRPPSSRGRITPDDIRKRISDHHKAQGIKPPWLDDQCGEKNHRYGKTWPDEHKQLISQWLRDRGSPSEETKQKIGDKQRGEKNHRYGKHWSDEDKQSRSEWAIENGIKPPVRSGPMSDDQKKAIGKSNTGKKRTLEQCAELSRNRKGRLRLCNRGDQGTESKL